MDIDIRKQNNCTVIKLTGRMDAVTAPEFETECAKRMEEGEKIFVVDLNDLEYISSAGLRSILATAKKLKAVQGEIRFCRLRGMVQEVFAISGFATMFPISDTVEAATDKG